MNILIAVNKLLIYALWYAIKIYRTSTVEFAKTTLETLSSVSNFLFCLYRHVWSIYICCEWVRSGVYRWLIASITSLDWVCGRRVEFHLVSHSVYRGLLNWRQSIASDTRVPGHWHALLTISSNRCTGSRSLKWTADYQHYPLHGF